MTPAPDPPPPVSAAEAAVLPLLAALAAVGRPLEASYAAGGWRVVLRVEPHAPPGLPFVPTPFQLAILDALEGKALKTQALGAAVGDKSRLYKPHGLQELRDRGLVAHHHLLGHFRPDAPPPQLREEESR